MPENSSCSSASTCSRESCEGCPSKAKGGSGIAKEPMNKASNVKKVIGVVSGKGGVGKSSVTSLLALAKQREGYKVAILDGDITGPSIGRIFGVENKQVLSNGKEFTPVESSQGIKIMSTNLLLESNDTPVIWRGPVLAGMIKQFWSDVMWGDVDYMFVDMPPGTGDVPLTVFQSLPLDGIIIVTSPQELVGMIVSKAVNMAKKMDVDIIGVVENMSYVKCPDCDKKIYMFGKSHSQEVADRYQLPLLGQLPIDSELTQLSDQGYVENYHSDWFDEFSQKVKDI
mgnify:CR=1 FL=1